MPEKHRRGKQRTVQTRHYGLFVTTDSSAGGTVGSHFPTIADNISGSIDKEPLPRKK